MENKNFSDVIGNPSAPFENDLARRYALATNDFAVSHPSLPNYLALTGGSTFGITSDCTSCIAGGSNIVDQLESAGLSWKAYMGAMPSPCFTGANQGLYAKKHDPFLYYPDIARNLDRCMRVVPLTQLAPDMRAGPLPSFVWISPDLCQDTHDCPVATGDAFLSHLVPPLLDALGPGGVLFLTWDEGSTPAGCCGLAHGGQVAAIVAGPLARPHATSAYAYDHYSLLRTIEDLFGLAHLRNAGSPGTLSMRALLR